MLRLKKSLSEKIYLLSANQVAGDKWMFKVRGQTNNVYEQILEPNNFSCSCPDHKKGNKFCKHLLFLVGRVSMQIELAAKICTDKSNWKEAAFISCANCWVNRLKNHIGKNPTLTGTSSCDGGDCPVCFEEMKADEEKSQCTLTCKNWFHSECIKLWLESDHTTCPLCRSKWDTSDGVKEDNPVDVQLLASSAEAISQQEIKTDIVFSFDTTGSMRSCIADVRRNVESITLKLFNEIPGLRLGMVSHGDYCDGTDVINKLDFTDDKELIKRFIQNAPNTGGGGNGGEAYELVLRDVQKYSWRPDATMKSIVIIGDEPPHERNPENINWRDEAQKLADQNIQVFSIQCLNTGGDKEFEFYSSIARITKGYHLFLNQFSYIRDMIQAICYRQYNQDQLTNYEAEVIQREGGMNDSLRLMFDTILGRKTRDQIEAEMHPNSFRARYFQRAPTHHRSAGTANAAPSLADEADLHPCHPTKFQVFSVTDDIGIKEFCDLMHIQFQKGRGFYEFIKPEIIQPQKEIVLMNRDTGDLFEGEVARRIAGIGTNIERAKIKPGDLPKYRIFIQSTSVNRKLVANQGFLFEVMNI